jgi:hypothetical protein
VRYGAARKSFIMSATKSRLLFFPILFGALSLAFAQPSGVASFSFDRTSFPVWDFSGPYQLDHQVGGLGAASVELTYGVEIVQDLSGRLSGSGTTLVGIGSEFVAANYSLSGTVALGGPKARAIFSVRLTGQDFFAGQTRTFNISFSYNLGVTNQAQHLIWRAVSPVRGSVAIQGLGSASVVNGNLFSVPLPAGVDGHWTLIMQVIPFGRLAGTALASVDRVADPAQPVGFPIVKNLSFSLVGAYHAGMSQILLSPMPGSQGNSLQVRLSSGADGVTVVSRLTGKLLGQSISFNQ